MSKFFSRIFPGCLGYYKKIAEARKEALEEWLNNVASINFLYNTDEFVEFFALEAEAKSKSKVDVDV